MSVNGSAHVGEPKVVIMGAGFGGLAAAIELERAGRTNYTVLERHPEVGGVWQANDYPGAACDVPSIIYQFSYALDPDWSRRFGSQPEIRDYLRRVSETTGVRGHIRFNTVVTAATFDEFRSKWLIDLADGERIEADVFISAAGQLSEPSLPNIAGRESFRGAQFHSAEWDHSVDITDKRVALIGSGASAVQVVPAIAEKVGHLTVVQRHPNWIVGKYDWEPSEREKKLMRRVPYLMRAYHNVLWWWFEMRYPLVLRRLDPIRRIWEVILRRKIKRAMPTKAKAKAATPTYALGCNRILLSKAWYPTIARSDVDLVNSGVTEVTETGLRCADGTQVDADVIVWCTGFKPTDYLSHIKITGRAGLDLQEHWNDGPEAWLGLATPGFPNMFMVYGPNTGSLTNTLVYMFERQAAWIRQAVDWISAHGGWIDIDPEVNRVFNEEIQGRLGETVFTTGCPGWYTTDSGKVTQVWAGSHVEYGRRTAKFDPSHFVTGTHRS
jgi:cation diffusion facilitator CzcD-associated flavoprotein CzcO